MEDVFHLLPLRELHCLKGFLRQFSLTTEVLLIIASECRHRLWFQVSTIVRQLEKDNRQM